MRADVAMLQLALVILALTVLLVTGYHPPDLPVLDLQVPDVPLERLHCCGQS